MHISLHEQRLAGRPLTSVHASWCWDPHHPHLPSLQPALLSEAAPGCFGISRRSVHRLLAACLLHLLACCSTTRIGLTGYGRPTERPLKRYSQQARGWALDYCSIVHPSPIPYEKPALQPAGATASRCQCRYRVFHPAPPLCELSGIKGAVALPPAYSRPVLRS